MRNTPLFDQLNTRARKKKLRFHMPGHKGKRVFASPISSAHAIDFTELYGTGNLYDGTEPISYAEERCAKLFNVPRAYYITGGATQGIYASIFLCAKPGDRVLIDRGCHRSVYNAVALVGAESEYVTSSYLPTYGIAIPITADAVEEKLKAHSDITCVVITSPTYYGVVSDIGEISKVCKRYNAKLIVDSAHGAHFPFTPGMHSAVSLGADISVCSLHKTLPALGQAAVITTTTDFHPKDVRYATSLFGTSSPSYAIMSSMELSLDFMDRKGRDICKNLAERLSLLRGNINKKTPLHALSNESYDPLRLCICTKDLGISGYSAAMHLEEEFDIVCEMADSKNVLFIITAADTVKDIARLEKALIRLCRKYTSDEEQISSRIPPSSLPERTMSLSQALYEEKEEIKLQESNGRVASRALYPYPPGIPIVAPGEIIEEEHIDFLLRNGFFPEDPIQVIVRGKDRL